MLQDSQRLNRDAPRLRVSQAYLATTGVLFALLAVLHVWRLVVEWPGIRAEFWIVAGGSFLSAVLALWALKLLLALKRSTRPPSAAG
jgi:hypothetical protein